MIQHLLLHRMIQKNSRKTKKIMKQKKIKILFGKKAQFFMPLFVVVTLIIFSTLYIDLRAKAKQFEGDGNRLGERQAAVLAAASKGEKAKYYVDVAAQYAYATAVLQTTKQGYISSSDCVFYRGVPVVYGDTEEGKHDCMAYHAALQEAVEKKITENFNAALTPYLEAYEEVDIPDDNYIVLLTDGSVQGIAKEPVEIPIFSTTSAKVQEATEQQIDALKNSLFGLIDIWPVEYEEKYVTSCFGYREIEEGSKYHAGVDIRAHGNVPVLAVLPGKVTVVDPYKLGRVVIDHENGISTAYLHLDTIAVKIGQSVEKGTVLGKTGGRGYNRETKVWGQNALPEHLHFEVIDTNIHQVTDNYGHKGLLPEKNPDHVNPLCYLSSTLEYDYNPATEKNCVAWGGPLKFCELYREQTGISATTTATGTTTYKATASTKAMLNQIDANYGKIIEQAVIGTAVSKALVIAVIAAESKRDDKTDPTKAIPAVVRLLQDNMNRFTRYSESEAFALASYNGGASLVNKAIASTGKSDPSWKEVSAALNQEIIAEVYSESYSSYIYEKYFGTTEKRNEKIQEIQNYVGRVMNYYYYADEKQQINKITGMDTSITGAPSANEQDIQETENNKAEQIGVYSVLPSFSFADTYHLVDEYDAIQKQIRLFYQEVQKCLEEDKEKTKEDCIVITLDTPAYTSWLTEEECETAEEVLFYDVTETFSQCLSSSDVDCTCIANFKQSQYEEGEYSITLSQEDNGMLFSLASSEIQTTIPFMTLEIEGTAMVFDQYTINIDENNFFGSFSVLEPSSQLFLYKKDQTTISVEDGASFSTYEKIQSLCELPKTTSYKFCVQSDTVVKNYDNTQNAVITEPVVHIFSFDFYEDEK